jgi:hypothetical protein
VPGVLELEIREILHPGPGTGHGSVAHASLRTGSISENSIWLERVCGRCNFRRYTLASPVLPARSRYDHACQVADASGLAFAPAEVDR